jgi:hypothetical protein
MKNLPIASTGAGVAGVPAEQFSSGTLSTRRCAAGLVLAGGASRWFDDRYALAALPYLVLFPAGTQTLPYRYRSGQFVSV